MKHQFYKYHGTGNDFIIIDNRQHIFDKKNAKLISELCDRRFGIGADGLILLEDHPKYDFEMVYFNADGHTSSMCGNGGRCITHFARYLGIISNSAIFEAIDGLHFAKISGDDIELQMNNVTVVKQEPNYLLIDTGSPHYILLSDQINDLDIKQEGSKIRYSKPFKDEGINVNFVEKKGDASFMVRTYERGVEDETLSCGTGVTAVALAMNYIGETEKNIVDLKTKGGDLKVAFNKKDEGYTDVWLIGPAVQVFKGEIIW